MPSYKIEEQPMRLVRERILTGLTDKGWTQERLELEAKFGQGYLTRILKGKQQRILPRTLKRIEDALDMPRGSLAGSPLTDETHAAMGYRAPREAAQRWDAADARSTRYVPPPLSELPGYADIEIQVARLEPTVPVAVFHEARQARFAGAPDPLTVSFVRGLVRFLAQHCAETAQRSGTESRTAPTVAQPQRRAPSTTSTRDAASRRAPSSRSTASRSTASRSTASRSTPSRSAAGRQSTPSPQSKSQRKKRGKQRG